MTFTKTTHKKTAHTKSLHTKSAHTKPSSAKSLRTKSAPKNLRVFLQRGIYAAACVCITYASCAYMYAMTAGSIVCTIMIAIMEIEKNILLRHAINEYSLHNRLKKYGWFCVVMYCVFSAASMWGVYNYALSKMRANDALAVEPVAPAPPAMTPPQATPPQATPPQHAAPQAARDDYADALLARAKDLSSTPLYRAIARQRLDDYMQTKMQRDIMATKKEMETSKAAAEQQLQDARAKTAMYATQLAEYKKKHALYKAEERNIKAKSGLTSLLLELVTSISCVINAAKSSQKTAGTTGAEQQQQHQQSRHTITTQPPTPRHRRVKKKKNNVRRQKTTTTTVPAITALQQDNVIRLADNNSSTGNNSSITMPSRDYTQMSYDYTQMTIREIMRIVKCGPQRATRIQRGLERNPVTKNLRHKNRA